MDDLDADGNLLLESGKKIPRLAVTPSLFIDRTVAIYGPSKTGKSVAIKGIMAALKGHIEQVIVVSPTQPTNRAYTGYVDPPFIHYRLFLPNPENPKKDDGVKGAVRFLEAVWSRQEMLAAIYTRANNADTLARLFGRLPQATRAEGLRHIGGINDKRGKVVSRVRRQFADEPGQCDTKTREVNDKFRMMLVLLYKKYIAPEYEALWACGDLSEDEQYSLTYLQLNPRLLLIFDDCAAELKPLFGKEIFRKIFYQNRHVFLTVVSSNQDDTDLPANLRKNAFVSIFTEAVVCASNFDRASNKFPKPTKDLVAELAAGLFAGHRKLAYIREDDRRQHFYHVQFADHRPFRFGSAALQELCDEVQSAGVAMDVANPFYEHFRL